MTRSAYVEQIGRNFQDVPWKERQKVLDDVAAHLADVDLPPDDIERWIDELGTPWEYARRVRGELGLGTDRRIMERAGRFRFLQARRRTQAGLVAGVFLIASLTSAFVWVHRVQPLELLGGQTVGKTESFRASDQEEVQYTWTPGGSFALGYNMRNKGRVPVRVTGFDLDLRGLPWDDWRVTLPDEDPRLAGIPGETPFRPFTLAAGDSRTVWIRGEFRHCPTNYVDGGSTGIDRIPVRFEVLGIHRTEVVRLNFSYSVLVPDPRGC